MPDWGWAALLAAVFAAGVIAGLWLSRWLVWEQIDRQGRRKYDA